MGSEPVDQETRRTAVVTVEGSGVDELHRGRVPDLSPGPCQLLPRKGRQDRLTHGQALAHERSGRTRKLLRLPVQQGPMAAVRAARPISGPLPTA